MPKRRRRWLDGAPNPIDTLPQEWRGLTARWLRRSQANLGGCRWDTLAKVAGPESYALAQQVLKWLVGAGWVAVVEERRHGEWWPARVEFIHPASLGLALGLPDPQAPARRWAELRALLDPVAEPDLAVAIDQLDDLPAGRAAERAELLLALARWRTDGRSGTRRDFAHFARGATKAISDAEWRWLDITLNLAAFAVERHTPLLLIAGAMVLELPSGLLDIGTAPDFASLTPATIAAARAARGTIAAWQVVENRTNFERLARQRNASTAVVWLPGFPPGWWWEGMTRLLALAPAPAQIACDPDPDGVAIALLAGTLWEESELRWTAWNMDAEALARLPARRKLTERDRDLLGRITVPSHQPDLARLIAWMRQHGEKGEQEGIF